MRKVLLVEDSPLVLERLMRLLDDVPGVQVVGHASGADEAVRAILATRPDIVVLDLKLSQGTGFDVLLEAHDKAPGTDFYMLSNFAAEPYRRQAARLGVKGFFDKVSEFENLRATLKGDLPCPASSL